MAEASAAPRRRARGLLTTYYGGEGKGADASGDPLDDVNIDANNFNATKYVSSLLQYKSLEELVARGNSMVSEIKSLDSDMQMLVYENYSKFISATDTIQEMKQRVDGMSGSMAALEENFNYISKASDGVSSSFSARRAELEKLNAVKRNLNKLQFLLELPARLQRCVAAGEYSIAVRCHLRAARLMAGMGTVAAFEGIRSECELIMSRLSTTLSARLEQDQLGPEELGTATGLLLKLGGDEEALLKKYLARRRKALADAIAGFTPAPPAEAADDDDKPVSGAGEGGAAGGGTQDGTEGGEGEAAAEAEEEEGPALPACAAYTRELGALVVPQLLQMLSAWRELFCEEAAEGTASGPAGETAAARRGVLAAEAKEGMLLEAVGEVASLLIESCRRNLADEVAISEHLPSISDNLLAGAAELFETVAPFDEALPAAKLAQRITRACEALAKKAIEVQMSGLKQRLGGAIASLVDKTGQPGADTAEEGSSLQAELRAAAGAVSEGVREGLEAVAPLLEPMCELLRLRADGMALHLVGHLRGAVQAVLSTALQPRTEPRAVLLCAGLCLHMAAVGVAEVPATLRAVLAPQGLGGAALGFDAAGLLAQFRRAAEELLQRLVERQAQLLSLGVSQRIQATDWLHCAAPSGVTPLVRSVVGELRSMQRLAASLFPTESTRPMLPHGHFPPITPLEAQLAQKLAASSGASSSIQTDLQRLFAKKVSFETSAGFGGKDARGGANQATLAAMVAHVAKLTIKTLVEEVRGPTLNFSRPKRTPRFSLRQGGGGGGGGVC